MAVRAFDWIAHHALRTPDRDAAIDLHTGRRYTYAALDLRCRRLASALRADFGVKRGDRVSILAPNSTDLLELQFACWKLGAVFVPLNWRLAVPELEYIVKDAGPPVLIYDAEFESAVLELGKTCPVRHFIRLRPGDADCEYEQAIAARGDGFDGAPAKLDELCAILYTSGTTGRPKGVMITHGINFFNAVNVGLYCQIGQNSRGLAIMPLFHAGGLNVSANPIFHAGACLAVMRTFEPSQALEYLCDPALAISHFMAVPTNYLMISQCPEFEAAEFPHLTFANVGAAPAPRALLQTWAAKDVGLAQAYGMTETGPLVTGLDPLDATRKIGSCGKQALYVDVRLVDAHGNDVAAGDIGEIWVRGPAITPGYWNLEAETEAAFKDGWLCTGDAARKDDEGYYYIVDRWKDMYISGGENVYPAEVEDVIYQLDGVGEAAVIGVAHEKWGEVGRAVVVRKPGRDLTGTEVIEHCARMLAKYKAPKSVVFIDEMPHNATGKIAKNDLRRQFGQPM